MEPIQLLFKNRLKSLQRTKQLCLMQQERVSSGSKSPTLVTAIIATFAECIRYSNQNSPVVPSIAAEQQSHQRMQTWRRSLLIGSLGQETADVLTSCFATVLILFSVHISFRIPVILSILIPANASIRTQTGAVMVCYQCQPKFKIAYIKSETCSCWLHAVCYFILLLFLEFTFIRQYYEPYSITWLNFITCVCTLMLFRWVLFLECFNFVCVCPKSI